jgi:hypothetical protein
MCATIRKENLIGSAPVYQQKLNIIINSGVKIF